MGNDGRESAEGDKSERTLSRVLDQLEASIEDESVSVGEIVERMGRRSFPAVILVPALIAVSPASGIPGLTAAVGLVVAATVAQILLGRDCLWLPRFLSERRISSEGLYGAVGWLRRPVGFVERFLRPRLTVLVTRPLVFLPLLVMLGVALCMPLLELIPMSGSIAAAAISLFTIGLLMRDGVLVLMGLVLVVAAPVAIWQIAA